MSKKIELPVGFVSGLATVLYEDGRDKTGRCQYRCLCRCGKEFTALGSSLAHKRTRSCGCLQREVARECMHKNMVKQGMWAEHRRLMMSIRTHVTMIMCDSNPEHRNYKYLRVPAKFLGNSGVTRFAQEVVRRFPKEAEEYERNKTLELDKDISGDSVFAPWNIRFVTRIENQNCRRNTRKLNGVALAMICREEGIDPRKDGKVSPEYNVIGKAFDVGEIHPHLWNARKQNLEKEERLLEITKLKCRRAELMIDGIKKLIASKQTA